MRMRKIRDGPDLLRRVHRAVLRRLRDRDRARLHVMLVPDVVQMLADSRDGDLSVRRRNREQLASDVLFGGTTLGSVDVRRLGADHRLVRLHHALQAEHVRRRAAEYEKYFRITAQFGGDPGNGVARVWIAAVRRNMAEVRGGHRFKDLGMHTGPIVARERASRLLLVRHAPTITAGSGEREEGSANSTMGVQVSAASGAIRRPRFPLPASLFPLPSSLPRPALVKVPRGVDKLLHL